MGNTLKNSGRRSANLRVHKLDVIVNNDLHDGDQIVNVFDTKFKAVLNKSDCEICFDNDMQPDPTIHLQFLFLTCETL